MSGYGSADTLKLADIEEPDAGPGELKVRVATAGINTVDWKLRSGSLRAKEPLALPTVLGRDVAGEVVAVGEGVTEFAPGDRVMGLVQHGYAEYVVAPVSAWARLPPTLPFVTAGALPLVGLTGRELAEDVVDANPGQFVLVTGALGGVGRIAVHASKRRGAIVFAGVRASQRDAAEELDVQRVVALDDPKDVARLPGLDAIADTVDGDALDAVLDKVRPGGVVGSVVGVPLRAKERRLRVRTLLAHADPVRLAELGRDAAAGAFRLPIDWSFPLAEAPNAHRLAEAHGVGKVILTP